MPVAGIAVDGDEKVGFALVGDIDDFLQAVRLEIANDLHTCGSEILLYKFGDTLRHIALSETISTRSWVWISVRRMTGI